MAWQQAQDVLINLVHDQEAKASRIEQKAATGMGLLPIFVALTANLASDMWSDIDSSKIIITFIFAFFTASLCAFIHFFFAVSARVAISIEGKDVINETKNNNPNSFSYKIVEGLAQTLDSARKRNAERSFDMMVGYFSVLLMLFAGGAILLVVLFYPNKPSCTWNVTGIVFGLILIFASVFARKLYGAVSRIWH